MIGITSIGGYIPRYRLSGKLLAQVWGAGSDAGERAVANYDEDSLTMACDAALNALHGRDSRKIGACFLASTTPPYLEKSSATILATAIDLSHQIITADVGGSLRCGTTALRLALDTVKAGSVSQALVARVRHQAGRSGHAGGTGVGRRRGCGRRGTGRRHRDVRGRLHGEPRLQRGVAAAG